MRNLSDIKNELIAKLQESPTWRRLLRGLIGQELASWGAATAFLDDVAYDSLLRDIHPSSASDLGLSLLSASYQIPFQNFSPGYILYKYEGSVALKPYGLTYSDSGMHWFNIDPVLSGDKDPQIVKLYQGSPVGVVSLAGAFQPVFPNITEVLEVFNSDVYSDPDNVFFYVRLQGSNIIPSSIRVHRLSVVGVFPDTSYKASMLTSEELSSGTYFSIYSLPDGGQAVRFNESIPDLFQITYFTADLRIPESVTSVGTLPLVSMYNPSATNTAKRSGFMSSMVKDSALSTSEQIEQFCRAMNVLDAKAERYILSSGLVSVVVFFIPSVDSQDEVEFFMGSLSEALSLYGSIATTFSVEVGTGVGFQVLASSQTSFDRVTFEGLVEGYFTTISPISFLASLTESLLVYVSDNGFSGVSLTYLLKLPKSMAFILPRFNAAFLHHSFFRGESESLVAWSFGSDILGYSKASPLPFLFEDTYFVMTKSVLVRGEDYAYIFDKVTGYGSRVNLDGYNILAMGDDTVLLENTDPSSNQDLLYIMRFTALFQSYAISTGKLPDMYSYPVGSVFKSSARMYDNGFFSCGTGSETTLYQAPLSSDPILVGATPNLLFVYKGSLYFPSTTPSTLVRKSSPTSNSFNVTVGRTGTEAISVEELFGGSLLRFNGNIMSATLDNKTFMFTLIQDSYQLAAAAFPGEVKDGIEDCFAITDTFARWFDGTAQWFDVTDGWVDFAPVVFSTVIGSILSGGAPSFNDKDFDYDFLTVETSSASPFSSSMEAIYFRLNQTTPVVYK